jgi:hypothetical protein
LIDVNFHGEFPAWIASKGPVPASLPVWRIWGRGLWNQSRLWQ